MHLLQRSRQRSSGYATLVVDERLIADNPTLVGGGPLASKASRWCLQVGNTTTRGLYTLHTHEQLSGFVTSLLLLLRCWSLQNSVREWSDLKLAKETNSGDCKKPSPTCPRPRRNTQTASCAWRRDWKMVPGLEMFGHQPRPFPASSGAPITVCHLFMLPTLLNDGRLNIEPCR